MAKMQHDEFEAWIRDRSRGCMDEEEIDEICEADLDFDTGEYTFRNQGVQAQWEAWKANPEIVKRAAMDEEVAAEEAMYACEAPDPRTWWQKFVDWLYPAPRSIRAGLEIPPEYKDAIIGSTVAKLTWKDRFLVLFSGVIRVEWITHTEHLPGKLMTHSQVWVASPGAWNSK